MKQILFSLILLASLLTSCKPVNLDSPMPVFNIGVDPETWVVIPAGGFLSGQNNHPAMIDYEFEIMVTDVTVKQYIDYLNNAFGNGSLKVDGNQLKGFYPGDEFHGAKHEVEISAADYVQLPLEDPASPFTFDGLEFSSKSGYENHPMTNVSWFGAWSYCEFYGQRLPTELEWEKAARGSQDGRAFPWGDVIVRNNANFYASRDPFEDMSSVGSRTTPVGFYNGRSYNGFQTRESASPFGLYDMAGNVWQWTSDVHRGMHYRFLRGGSKDTYDMDLRIWVRNNATPTYYSPAVGFRCVRSVTR